MRCHASEEQVLSGLSYLVAFLVAIGILVTVHELGHYLAARLCGVKVLKFSFGFGRTIYSRTAGRDQTEWAIGLVPLGGYVKMLDEREGDVSAKLLDRAFNRQSIFRRALIVFAGPFSNLLLAVLIYWGIALGGIKDLSSQIGIVTSDSIAAHAGLLQGDRVLRANGSRISGWSAFRWFVMDHALGKESLVLDVDRGGVEVSGLELNLSGVVIGEQAPDVLAQVGVAPPQPHIPPVIGGIQPGSPAERAGFLVGDVIRAIDGVSIVYWSDVVAKVSGSPGRQLSADVERNGSLLGLKVTPDPVPGRANKGRIGVQVRADDAAIQANTVDVSYGVADGFLYAVGRTWDTATFSLKVMWQMITGSVSLRNVSGPVTIADYAGQSAAIGFEAYLGFVALVSISIGVLNLLPIPILDGGHLLYYVAEFLRGKPLPERLEEYGQKLGLAILAGLMSLAIFKRSESDYLRLMSKKLTAIHLGVLSLFSPYVFAANSFVVRDIRVEGIQRTEAGTVFNYLPIHVGDTVDDGAVSRAVKALFATGFYRDVRIEVDKDVLVVVVDERPAIAQVQFSGNKEFTSDILTKGLKDVGIAESRTFDRSMLEKAEQEIKRLYLTKSFYGVSIKTTVSPMERNRVAINFEVTEGEVARIKNIKIIGAKAFKESRLLDLMTLEETGWFSWFLEDKYSKQKLQADIEEIKSWYLDRGYLNFSVDSTQVSITPDKKDVFITVAIIEGEQYTVSSVKLAGELLVPEEDLRKLVTIKSGDMFSRSAVNEVTRKIADRIGNDGYAFANVNAAPEVDEEKHQVALTFFVDPGRRAYVNRINVTGNNRTRDEVVRREMRQAESAWFDREKVDRSKLNIDRTGFFEDVSIDTVAVPGTPDQVDLSVNVKEKATGALTFGRWLFAN